jgi:transposase
MSDRKRSDPKLESLRKRSALNPRPERVVDDIFSRSNFFDRRDLIQVKYEMIRRVQVEGSPVSLATETFGFSRPSFYEVQAAFKSGGLAGLLPKKRGPRSAHKLGREVMDFIDEVRAGDASVTASALVPLVRERFGVDVHVRSVERALARREKKRL